MSFNLLAKGGIHTSMAMNNWFDSTGLYFIWANFPLYLFKKLMKGSPDPYFVFYNSWRETSNYEFNTYCLMKIEHSTFQSR